MLDFFRIIRYKNLLIVAFAQSIIYLTVHLNFFQKEELTLQPLLFILLMISTILITGAGYIINDYFDVKIDSINRPETLIISTKISSKHAVFLHNFLNIISVLLSGYVAYEIGQPFLVIIQIISITLLWFYSTHFKRMSIIGNVVVSFMTAMSILLLLIFEPTLYPTLSVKSILIGEKINPSIHIFVVSIFAFLLNWMREIIKDIEDLKGDYELGCKTYPIVHGLKKSIRFIHIINISTIFVLIISIYFLILMDKYLSGFILIIPISGLIYFSYRLPQLSTFRQFGKLSRLLKWLMIIGLLDLLIITYL